MLYRAISANIGPTDAMAQVREYCLSVNSPASPRNVFPRIVHSLRIGMSEKPNVIHTAGRVYKKSVMCKLCANSNPNPNPNLGHVPCLVCLYIRPTMCIVTMIRETSCLRIGKSTNCRVRKLSSPRTVLSVNICELACPLNVQLPKSYG